MKQEKQLFSIKYSQDVRYLTIQKKNSDEMKQQKRERKKSISNESTDYDKFKRTMKRAN